METNSYLDKVYNLFIHNMFRVTGPDLVNPDIEPTLGNCNAVIIVVRST